jgi:small conductance mechanosensitive channel
MLGVFNISLGPLLAGAGVAGVALGFGAQNVVRDTLAGTFMILEDQLGVGDTVDLGEAVGTVERVTLRATRLRDVNGTVWYVPNGQVLRVGNKSQDWAQAVLDVEVGIDSDLDEVRAVLHDVAQGFAEDPQWSGVVLEPPEVWGVEALTPFTYTVRLVVKTRPGVQWGVMRELRARLLAALDAAGIHFR